jgi:hypothetical protein
VAFSLCSPGALGLESLSQDKAAFSLCSPIALGLDGLEREESTMYDSFE